MAAGTHIVVVEDEPEIRCLMHDLLSAAGYTVRPFEDGREALAALDHDPTAQLIILDVVMEPMGGVEFLTALQAHPALRAIPVLICSGVSACERLTMPGHPRVLRKPFGLNELLQAVREVAASR